MPLKRIKNRSVINDLRPTLSTLRSSEKKYIKKKYIKKKYINKDRIKQRIKREHTKLEKDLNESTVLIQKLNTKANVVSFASLGSAVAFEYETTLIGLSKDDPLEIDFEKFRYHKFPFENIGLKCGGIKGLDIRRSTYGMQKMLFFRVFPFNAWCPLKIHSYLNKLAAFVCRFKCV